MPKNQDQYAKDQKSMGGKISWEEYEAVLKELDANLLRDPTAPYITAAVEALNNNIALRINKEQIAQSNPAQMMSQDDFEAYQKSEKTRRKKSKKAHKYKSTTEQNTTPEETTLATKLSPLPHDIIDKIENIAQDFRNHKKTIKRLFKGASKTNRKEAIRVIKSPNLTLTEAGKLQYSDMQLSGLYSVEQKREEASKKIRQILRNPINGFKADAIEIIKNQNIRTKDVDEFLPDEMTGMRRDFAKTLIMESKREYMFYQNLFKKLDPKILEEFTKAVNQEGAYKGMGFKHIRPFIGPGGTAEYIKNSGLVTDRQNDDVKHLIDNLDSLKNDRKYG